MSKDLICKKMLNLKHNKTMKQTINFDYIKKENIKNMIQIRCKFRITNTEYQ